MSENTRTVVTVHPIFSPDFTVSVGENARVIQHAGTNVVCYDATDFTVTDGALVIMDRSDTTDAGRIGILRELAAWAPATWSRAEVTEAPADPDGLAEVIARRHYDGLTPFETSRDDDGPESLANKLTAAALDGLRA